MTRLRFATLAVCAVLSGAPAESSIDGSLFVAAGKVEGGLSFEKAVSASPESVFDAWSTEAGVRAFLDIAARIDLRIGGAYELYFDVGEPEGQRGSEGCQVLSYVPGRMLSFTWNAPPRFAAERAARTWIVLTFEPLEGGRRTHVRVEHLGFGEGERWAEVKQHYRRAWPRTLEALVRHFAQ